MKMSSFKVKLIAVCLILALTQVSYAGSQNVKNVSEKVAAQEMAKAETLLGEISSLKKEQALRLNLDEDLPQLKIVPTKAKVKANFKVKGKKVPKIATLTASKKSSGLMSNATKFLLLTVVGFVLFIIVFGLVLMGIRVAINKKQDLELQNFQKKLLAETTAQNADFRMEVDNFQPVQLQEAVEVPHYVDQFFVTDEAYSPPPAAPPLLPQ